MSNYVFLPPSDERLVRRQILFLQILIDDFLNAPEAETVHRLRSESRRLREMLLYLGNALPPKWSQRLEKLSKEITKRLGRTRELENNIHLVDDLRIRGKADPVSAELLLNIQNQEIIKSRRKAELCLLSRRFTSYEKFSSTLKSSRNLPPLPTDFLTMRMKEFVEFAWNIPLDDHKLHELMIRAERLRYALEIREKLTGRKQGRLLKRVHKLQLLLGQIDNLFVLRDTVKRLRRDSNYPDLKLISKSLRELSRNVFEEKNSLYDGVYPLFARIVPALTSELRPAVRLPVRSSLTLETAHITNPKHSNRANKMAR